MRIMSDISQKDTLIEKVESSYCPPMIQVIPLKLEEKIMQCGWGSGPSGTCCQFGS